MSRPGPVRRLRDELGQVAWVGRELRGSGLRRVIQVSRAMERPDLPRARRVPGSVWGVSVVRDEADVLPSVLQHLLDQGLAGILIADNGSTDGTADLVRDIAAADARVHLVRDSWPRHDQSEKMSLLARHAGRAGADWIVPFDADEFWFAEDATLGTYFSRLVSDEPETTALFADWFTMVPTSATRSVGPDTEFLLDASPVFPGKVAVRAHPLLVIAQGNHAAARIGGRRRGEVSVAHAIYRAPEQVARKLRQGAAAESASRHVTAPHWQAGATMSDAHIHDVWRRIAHGQAVPEVAFPAVGPMVTVRPQTWSSWDPDGTIATALRPPV